MISYNNLLITSKGNIDVHQNREHKIRRQEVEKFKITKSNDSIEGGVLNCSMPRT